MSAATGLGTKERVRNSRGKRAIGVRPTEVLLYFCIDMLLQTSQIALSYFGIHLRKRNFQFSSGYGISNLLLFLI